MLLEEPPPKRCFLRRRASIARGLRASLGHTWAAKPAHLRKNELAAKAAPDDELQMEEERAGRRTRAGLSA